MMAIFKKEGPKNTNITRFKLQPKTFVDLEELLYAAENRPGWKYIKTTIYKAVQVKKSMDYTTQGP